MLVAKAADFVADASVPVPMTEAEEAAAEESADARLSRLAVGTSRLSARDAPGGLRVSQRGNHTERNDKTKRVST